MIFYIKMKKKIQPIITTFQNTLTNLNIAKKGRNSLSPMNNNNNQNNANAIIHSAELSCRPLNHYPNSFYSSKKKISNAKDFDFVDEKTDFYASLEKVRNGGISLEVDTSKNLSINTEKKKKSHFFHLKNKQKVLENENSSEEEEESEPTRDLTKKKMI